MGRTGRPAGGRPARRLDRYCCPLARCGTGWLALAAIPPEKGLSHCRFLYRGPVPSVRAETDIGQPPRCIEEISAHVRLELTQPELRRRYRLRRCLTKLLCGPSGTGKSLTLAAIQRRIYEIIDRKSVV